MKKISVNNILFILVFSIFLLILFYAYLSFCLSDGSLKTFVSDIVLSLINGLFLALVVLVAGIFIEEKRRREIAIQTGEEEIAKLKNILKNVFNRAKSSLNFLNRTPTFYFDDNWINPMYELLTQNKREWDTFLQEYLRSNPSSKIAEELLNFIRKNLSEREPFYRKAAFVVSGTDEEMLQQILSFLGKDSFFDKRIVS